METLQFQTRISTDIPDGAVTVMPDYLEKVNISRHVVLVQGLSTGKSRNYKNTMAWALLPTLISPVIESPADTVILANRLSPPSAAAISKRGESEMDLSFALDGFEVKGLADVENYLNRNYDLLSFLSSLPDHISNAYGVESVELELYHDIEEHWEKLFVIVNTQIDDMDELDVLEDSLFSSLFEPRAELLFGRVVLSID